MNKNRLIIILGIFTILIAGSGFPPITRQYLIQIFAAFTVILAFLIEKKGVFSLDWHKRNPVTSVAKTYVEHNGSNASDSTGSKTS